VNLHSDTPITRPFTKSGTFLKRMLVIAKSGTALKAGKAFCEGRLPD